MQNKFIALKAPAQNSSVIYFPGKLPLAEIEEERVQCLIPGNRRELLLRFLEGHLSLMTSYSYIPKEVLKVDFFDLRLFSSGKVTDILSDTIRRRTEHTFKNKEKLWDFLMPLLACPFDNLFLEVHDAMHGSPSQPLVRVTPQNIYIYNSLYNEHVSANIGELKPVLLKLCQASKKLKVVVEYIGPDPVQHFRRTVGNKFQYIYQLGTTTLPMLLAWFSKYTVTYVKLGVRSPATPFSLLVFRRQEDDNISITFEH